MESPKMNILIWLLCLLPSISAEGTEQFMIEEFYMCDDVPEQPVKLYMTLRTATHGTQTVDFNMTSPKPIGENANLKYQMSIEVNHHWHQMMSSEKDFCYIFKTYVGQLIYDLERVMGIIPGTCPIPRGTYHAVNYTFNFETLKLQAFAIGRMKFRLETYEKTTRRMRSCVIVIIQNGK